MIKDAKLISDFLRNYGDIIYFKMIYGDLLDLTTVEGIDLLFLKTEEFAEECALYFDTDEFLHKNSYMVDYYLNDPENSILWLSYVSYGDYLFSSLNSPLTPTFDDLFTYLRVPSTISTIVQKKLVKDDVVISHLLRNTRYKKFLTSNPYDTFHEADTEVVDSTTSCVPFSTYDTIFQEHYLVFWSWLNEPSICVKSDDINILWINMFLFKDRSTAYLSSKSIERLWWYLVLLKLPVYYTNSSAIFFEKFQVLDGYLNYLSFK